MTDLLGPLAGQVADEEIDACGVEPGEACSWVLEQTGNELLAKAVDFLLARPLKIAVIVVLAVAVNRLLQRGIRRFVQSLENSAVHRSLGTGGASLVAPGPLSPRAQQRAQTIGGVLRSLTRAIIWVIAGLLVLGEIGINLGPLLAGAGIVGVAVGFGSQTLVKDFLSGMFMLIEDQFGVGDIIDAGEASGVVEAISLRTTRLRDVEGVLWHIPNGEIRRVGNKSQEWARALLDVEVAYQTDLAHARRVIKQVADELWRSDDWGPSILDEPEVWGVEALGASGIAIRLVLRTRPSDQFGVMRELRARLKDAFDAEGIEIPFPQQAVWVRSPGSASPYGPDTADPGGGGGSDGDEGEGEGGRG